MTKKLEDLLNLPDSKQIVEESRKEKIQVWRQGISCHHQN